MFVVGPHGGVLNPCYVGGSHGRSARFVHPAIAQFLFCKKKLASSILEMLLPTGVAYPTFLIVCLCLQLSLLSKGEDFGFLSPTFIGR